MIVRCRTPGMGRPDRVRGYCFTALAMEYVTAAAFAMSRHQCPDPPLVAAEVSLNETIKNNDAQVEWDFVCGYTGSWSTRGEGLHGASGSRLDRAEVFGDLVRGLGGRSRTAWRSCVRSGSSRWGRCVA